MSTLGKNISKTTFHIDVKFSEIAFRYESNSFTVIIFYVGIYLSGDIIFDHSYNESFCQIVCDY